MTAGELQRHKIGTYGRDYSRSDNGYGDIEVNAEEGWNALSSWGLDGWDLGEWPFVVLSVRTQEEGYELLSVVEGDHTLYCFDSQEERAAAIDFLFVWYGLSRNYAGWIAAGIPAWDGKTSPARALLNRGELAVPAQLRGPFSSERLDRERHGSCEVCGRAISSEENTRLSADIDFVSHGVPEHWIRRVRP
jgi:hypothetical protein